MKQTDKTHFIVTYRDPKDGAIMSLKANKIHDSSLGLAFVAISEFMFDKNKMVVTPEEEALEKRLANVRTLHISIYSILTVQEVGSKGNALKFKHDKSNLLVLPTGSSTPPAK